MGWFGRSEKWECVRCGEPHRSNPEECKSCGYTVLQRPGAEPSHTTTIGSEPVETSSGASSQWQCAKCGNVHDMKPFVCQDCGASALREVASDPGSTRIVSSTASSSSGSLLGGLLVLILWLTAIGVALYVGALAAGFV